MDRNLKQEICLVVLGAFLGALLGAVLGIFGTWGYDKWKENLPLAPLNDRTKPSQEFPSVTLRNPSTQPYKLVDASFKVQRREKPGNVVAGAPIDSIRISFTPDDYDQTTQTYRRVIENEQIEPGKLARIRVSIIDPKYDRWAFYGKLTISYTGRDSPYEKDGFAIQVAQPVGSSSR